MSLLQKIKQILSESTAYNLVESFDHPALIGTVKTLANSGRYEVSHVSTDDNNGYHSSHNFLALPNRPHDAVEFKSRNGDERKSNVGWYNPAISEVKNDEPESKYSRNRVELKADSGLHKNIEDVQKHGVIYRGMSHEEFHDIAKNGHIKSNGSANMGGQEGLTYYSKDPSQAQFYAHGFAAAQHKATGTHHAYVVAVKDPGTDVKISGTGENEVGIPHPISSNDILHVHKGVAYSALPGQYETRHDHFDKKYTEGSSSGPTTNVAWKKMPYSEAMK